MIRLNSFFEIPQISLLIFAGSKVRKLFLSLESLISKGSNISKIRNKYAEHLS